MPRRALPLPFATRLSYRHPLGVVRRSLFSALARLSLMGFAATMSTACLIEDPPPYTQPRKTPPRLDLQGAKPPPDQIMVHKVDDPIEFRVPVVSEDAGDPLQGVLLLDYDGVFVDLVTFGQIPPSTLADENERAFTLPWRVRSGTAPGCHRFTLRVSHLSNFNREGSPHVVFDTKDLAEAYWWLFIEPETDGTTLVDCPGASSGGP